MGMEGFREEKITFKPTFKVFERKQKVIQYKPKRSPAWCDRVLFKSCWPKENIETLSYESAEDISTSDHKPVFATYCIKTWLLPPAYDDSKGFCFLEFEALDCQGLGGIYEDDSNASLNPYIKFSGSFLIKSIHTSTKRK